MKSEGWTTTEGLRSYYKVEDKDRIYARRARGTYFAVFARILRHSRFLKSVLQVKNLTRTYDTKQSFVDERSECIYRCMWVCSAPQVAFLGLLLEIWRADSSFLRYLAFRPCFREGWDGKMSNSAFVLYMLLFSSTRRTKNFHSNFSFKRSIFEVFQVSGTDIMTNTGIPRYWKTEISQKRGLYMKNTRGTFFCSSRRAEETQLFGGSWIW